MLDKNLPLFTRLNILPWYEAGYTGSRGLSATQEGWDIARYNYKGLVTMGDVSMLSDSAHPINTAKCFFEIAPDRKLIQLPFRYNNELSTSFFTTVFSALNRFNIDIMWGAITSPIDGKYLDPYLSQVASKFSYYMNVSNDAGEGTNKLLSSKYIHGVGAYYFDEKTGVPIPIENMKNRNNAITHVPSNLYIPYTNDEYGPMANCRKFSGASCGAAILAGMMALVNDMFLDKTGYPLSSAAAKTFIRKHSLNVGYGFNMFRLPDPDEVYIDEYVDKHVVTVHDITNRSEISAESIDAILFAINQGFMELNEEGQFDTTKPVTQEQLAIVIDRLHNTNHHSHEKEREGF